MAYASVMPGNFQTFLHRSAGPLVCTSWFRGSYIVLHEHDLTFDLRPRQDPCVLATILDGSKPWLVWTFVKASTRTIRFGAELFIKLITTVHQPQARQSSLHFVVITSSGLGVIIRGPECFTFLRLPHS
jgi:hypothetical protein